MMHDPTIYELQIFIVSNKVTEGSADRIRLIIQWILKSLSLGDGDTLKASQ